jgi:hypothetical protein
MRFMSELSQEMRLPLRPWFRRLLPKVRPESRARAEELAATLGLAKVEVTFA